MNPDHRKPPEPDGPFMADIRVTARAMVAAAGAQGAGVFHVSETLWQGLVVLAGEHAGEDCSSTPDGVLTVRECPVFKNPGGAGWTFRRWR